MLFTVWTHKRGNLWTNIFYFFFNCFETVPEFPFVLYCKAARPEISTSARAFTVNASLVAVAFGNTILASSFLVHPLVHFRMLLPQKSKL